MKWRLTRCCLSLQTSSYLDVTPSPNKVLTEHPLSAFIKTEEEEEETSCDVAAASVKQEVASEAGELPEVKKEEEPEVLTDVQSDEMAAPWSRCCTFSFLKEEVILFFSERRRGPRQQNTSIHFCIWILNDHFRSLLFCELDKKLNWNCLLQKKKFFCFGVKTVNDLIYKLKYFLYLWCNSDWIQQPLFAACYSL